MQINSTLLIVLLYCTLQVVFLGDSSVGKTCLARLLTEEKVQPTTDNTIGFDLHSKELIVDGVRVIVSETDIHQMITYCAYTATWQGSAYKYNVTRYGCNVLFK